MTAAQQPVHRQQHEPVLGHRALEVSELEPVGHQPGQQLLASRAGLALEIVQQPLRGEVHAGMMSDRRRAR